MAYYYVLTLKIKHKLNADWVGKNFQMAKYIKINFK